ncbi:MAG: alpha/beta fold hydrolase [Oceanospirillaceae bacterium]
MNKKNEFSLNINGMTMAGVAYGNDRDLPVLALHGWLDNAASFELLASKLTTRKVIAVDFIGHGKSSHRPVNSPYYIWDNVTDIYLAMQCLGLTKVDIIGHSMGASVAMLFAACFPQHVGKLFLIEGLAPLDYPASELPQLMAKSIRQHVKSRVKTNKGYANLQAMVDARANGRFPVSSEAAKLLVERGSKVLCDEFYWSSDSALLLPSINRMSKVQVDAFLQSVEAKVYVYLANEGIDTGKWQEYFKQIKQVEISTFDGNHHLHMQELGAVSIANAVNTLFSTQTSLV